jgi:hypothetical protein
MRAVARSPFGAVSKEALSIRIYFVATACSVIYFFVVSFALLRD